MSNDEKNPEYGTFDPAVQADQLIRDSIATKLINKARLYGVTSLYLAAFSILPFIYIVFQNWSFLPALAFSVFVLWRATMLRKEGIKAILLQIAAIIMIVLSVTSFFTYPPITDEFGKSDLDNHPFIELAWNVLMGGVFTLFVFAVMAVIFGAKSRRIAKSGMSSAGIILGSFHILCWVGFFTLITLML